MKIAIITSTFPPYRGGIGNIAYLNALALHKLGNEITVFTPDYKNSGETKNFAFNVEKIKPLFKYGNAAFCPQLLWKLKNFDNVILYYPFFGGAEFVSIYKLLKRNKIKLLVYYHMDVYLSGFSGLIIKGHRYLILPFIAKLADIIGFTTYSYGKNSFLKKHFIKNKKKYIEIPNGCDINFFRVITEAEKNNFKKINNLNNEKIILFCGGLDKAHYFKGVANLLQSFNDLVKKNYNKKIKLIIVGSGDLLEYYKKLAKNLNIENKVIFAQNVNNEDLIKYYNICDVLVLPSINKSEAFGVVLVEAMLCGKAVIASDLPGVRNVFNDKEHGFLIKPNNINDLTEKLFYILNNQELRKNIESKTRNFAESKYDYLKISKKINNYLKNLNENLHNK